MLFDSYHLDSKQLNNRYVVAPMTRISAEADGRANDRMKKYYQRFAKGGFGAIITEGIYPDTTFSQGYNNQPGIATDIQADAWKPVVNAVHEEGSIIIAQLMHAGGQSQGNAYTDETIAPSAIPPKGEQLGFYGGSGTFQTPRAMDDQDFLEVKKDFVAAARRAKEAGFDGVEIHGANGYLLDQFLTDYLNKREDEYGGTVENRLRFVLEVVDEILAEVGEDFIIGIRISQGKVADQTHKWAGGEKEAEQIFGALGKTGLDYIHVTDGDATAPSFGEGSKTLAGAAKTYGGITVIANGQLQEQERAESLLESGQADLVSIGTGALANPDLPNKVRDKDELNAFDFEKILLPQAEVKDHELDAPIKE
ncbi:NADH:flavin oxidoreductase [Halobacillus aidingensis]|uniref:2,4-dienoyl-CoA reductase n=1 Tax=Halobacillus aidingensis TaxID=240303 RepID=A0A1H0I7W5_HALAD|nr:NADH:flavin oxidoreductase [Halobacillus aidingensis]SDO27487.1 2,4-dienoyl-CoA reductase [Halobacillus aidingensis]